MNFIDSSTSARWISAEANWPWHLKISSFPTDLISNLSEIHDKSRIIFWKSAEGKLIMEFDLNENKLEIDVQGLSRGAYYLRIATVTTDKVIKVIK